MIDLLSFENIFLENKKVYVEKGVLLRGRDYYFQKKKSEKYLQYYLAYESGFMSPMMEACVVSLGI